MIPTSPKSPRSVIVAYAHNGHIEHDFMLSIINMIVHDEKHEKYLHSMIQAQGVYVTRNRNLATQQFLTTNAEWLLFVDTDMSFSPDSLKKLVEVADPKIAPIVGGLYFGFVGSNEVISPVWLANDGHSRFATLSQVNEDILTPLTVAGTGCLIIHRSVLEALQQKYANDPWPWFGHDIASLAPELPLQRLGEDSTFCVRATDAGFPVLGYAGVIMNHKKARLIGVKDYLVQYHVPQG